jgi:hypothetical protein
VLAVPGERGRHRDHEHVGRSDVGSGGEQPALDHAVHQTVEIDFLDMDLAAVDRVDHVLRHVDAAHVHARAGDDRRGGQADVAEPNDANGG